MNTSIGIIGIGNPLMRDDGIGVTVLGHLRTNPILSPAISSDEEEGPGLKFIELGTGGMTVLHYLAKLDGALIIDSGNMGLAPGEFRVFSPDEVESVKFLSGQSLHEFDLLQAIGMSRKLGECPPHLMIMAIQPESVEWGEGLSPSVEQNVDDYVSKAVETIVQLIAEVESCTQ